MPTPAPLDLLLVAAPDAPGADDLLSRAAQAARRGASVRVLLTGRGVGWVGDERLAGLHREGGAVVALCSRSAREQGALPDALPAWILWSSLTMWIGDRQEGAPLWTLLP